VLLNALEAVSSPSEVITLKDKDLEIECLIVILRIISSSSASHRFSSLLIWSIVLLSARSPGHHLDQFGQVEGEEGGQGEG
jgi:hypothetical protein